MNVFDEQMKLIDDKVDKIIENIEIKTNNICEKLEKRNKWLKLLWISYTGIMIFLIGIMICKNLI